MDESEPAFAWPDGRRAALSITFDDARLTQVDNGLPILNRHDVKGTFYVGVKRVESRLPGWREAVAAGHEMGNHSLTHPCSGNFLFSRQNALEHYTLEQIEKDILAANDAIQQVLGVSPTTFAYPCGQRTVGRGEGVQSYVPVVARHFVIGRTWLDEAAADPTFCDLAQVTGIRMDGASVETLLRLVDNAIEHGHWLVLCGHEVASPEADVTSVLAHGQDTVPKSLDALCAYARERADVLWTDTVAAVGSYVASERNARTADQRAVSGGSSLS